MNTDTPTNPAPSDKLADWDREPSKEEIETALEKARAPGLILIKTDRPDENGCQGSWLGGDANLPPDIDWPCFAEEVEEEIEDEDGDIYDEFVIKNIPKHLLAQINLATLPEVGGQQDMPKQGALFFFYEPNTASMYALNRKTVTMNCVIYVPDDVAQYPLRSRPAIPYPDRNWDDASGVPQQTEPFIRRPFEFYPYDGYRLIDVPANGLIRSRITQAFLESRDAVREQVSDRYFTYAERGTLRQARAAEEYFAQNPDNAAYFKMHHMFGGQVGKEPEGDVVRLLAIQSDPDLKFDYGVDWVTFWIEREDLKARRFEKAFIIHERA